VPPTAGARNVLATQSQPTLTLKCPSIDADGIKFQKLHGVFWKTYNDHIWTPQKIETPHFENTECIIFDTLGIRGSAFRVLATVQRIKRAMFSPIWSEFSTHIRFGVHIAATLCVRLLASHHRCRRRISATNHIV